MSSLYRGGPGVFSRLYSIPARSDLQMIPFKLTTSRLSQRRSLARSLSGAFDSLDECQLSTRDCAAICVIYIYLPDNIFQTLKSQFLIKLNNLNAHDVHRPSRCGTRDVLHKLNLFWQRRGVLFCTQYAVCLVVMKLQPRWHWNTDAICAMSSSGRNVPSAIVPVYICIIDWCASRRRLTYHARAQIAFGTEICKFQKWELYINLKIK